MGGRAFEMFIELMGRWATMQEWNAEITRLRGVGSNGPITQQAEDTILFRESSAFHGFRPPMQYVYVLDRYQSKYVCVCVCVLCGVCVYIHTYIS